MNILNPDLNTSSINQKQNELRIWEILADVDIMLARLQQTPEVLWMRQQLFRVANFVYGLDIDDFAPPESKEAMI